MSEFSTTLLNIVILADGRFEIDNNLVENDIRPTAVGRKRWLFIGQLPKAVLAARHQS